MATLTGNLVADTYKALLKMIDNDILTAAEKQISDGLGGGTNVFIDQNGFLRANKYKVTGATSSQFLKGDGSLDSTAYLPVGTSTTNIPEGTNLYFTTNRVLNTLLTGFSPVSGTVTASDSILTAINKIWWNIVNGGGGGGGYVPYTGATQNLNLGTYGLISDYVQFNTSNSSIPTTAGTMSWNDTDGTADLKLKGGNVTLQIGQEEVMRVVNKTGASLAEADFRAVRIRSVSEGGAQGQRLAVVLAQGDSDPHSATSIGLVTETIANNQEGFITTSGEVREINTTGAKSYGGSETWVDGDVLYLSPTHAGYLTKVKPQAPQHTIIIGWVVYAHAIHGKIYVKVDNGYELDELHNVKITDPQTLDVLIYDDAITGPVWINRNIYTSIGATDVGKGFLSIPNSGSLIPAPTKARWTRINVDNTVDAIEALDMGFIPYFRDTELFAKSPIYTTGAIVGIGTTSPTALLHLKGTTAYTELKLDNNSPTGGGMFIALQNANQVALFGADAYYQTNTSIDAAIVAKKTGGGIQFYTNGSTSEKMGINSDGNVFIGQTPTWTTSATNLIVRGKTGAGHIGVMHYDMSINGIFNTFNSLVQIGSTTFHSLAFIVDSVERGRINSSGRFLWNTSTDNGVDNVQVNGSLIATSLKKSGGTSAQYLMADGSVSTGPSLAGYVPTSRTLTINGTGYDLSADRSWNVGTVTSVSATVPTGFSISGSPITTSGTLAITFATGYALPTTAKQTQWDSAYTWVSGFPSQTGNSGKFLTTDGTNISWSNVVLGVTSFNTRTGAISLLSADVTGALGFTPVPTTRSLSINGTAYDLSADRAWTISAGSNARNVSTFTATSGQTTFTISGGYTANLVDVYVNGTRLNANDYVATSGTNVVLNVGVVLNDIVEIVNYIASASASISGSGSSGYITKWIGTSVVNNSLLYDDGTNIGIGTITPTAKLHIVGTALVSSSLTANSFVKSGGTSAQILMADGSVITAGTNITISGGTISASGGGSITGSGTTNYITKWTSTSAIGNSIIFDNGTKVGIGTVSPGEKLDIYSGASTAAFINLIGNGNTAGTSNVVIGQNSDDGAYFWNRKASFMSFGTSNTERMRIDSNGNVGIGTSSPQARLDVSGNDVNRSGLVVYNANTANGDKQIQIFVGGQTAYGVSAWQNSGVIESVAGLNSNFVLSNYQTGAIIFQNSGRIERMRITSGGIVCVAGAYNSYSADYKIQLGTESGNNGLIIRSGSSSIGKLSFDCGTNGDGVGKIWYNFSDNSMQFYTSTNGTNSFERMRINNYGDVGIGTSSPATRLHLNSSADTVIRLTSSSGAYSSGIQMYAAGAGAGFLYSNQSIYVTANANGVYLPTNGTSWVANSDINLKNIESYIENAIDSIMELSAIKFNWKADEVKTTNIGLIAQEVQKVYPELINKNRDGYLGVRYTELIPILVKAIQELNAKIEAK